MIGGASTPADRHRRDRTWNVPKCKTKIIPSIPTHPARSSVVAGTRRATPHNRTAPTPVLPIAQSHSFPPGLCTCLPGSRNPAASIPGQAKRNLTLRPIVAPAILRCSHQDCHLQPKKIAAASVHMKHHGARYTRAAIAAAGKTISGIQPGHRNSFGSDLGRIRAGTPVAAIFIARRRPHVPRVVRRVSIPRGRKEGTRGHSQCREIWPSHPNAQTVGAEIRQSPRHLREPWR